MSTFGGRLKEERLRLGLNQTAFAEIAGNRKQSQIHYEADKRSPDAKYLMQIKEHGADILYILTGIPAEPLSMVEQALRQIQHENDPIRKMVAEQKTAEDKILKASLDATKAYWESGAADKTENYHLVNLHEVQASAGGGALNESEGVLSSLAFRKQWLAKKGINPSNASLIYVAGDSMEPTLADSSVVLINHQSTEPHKRRMFAFREGAELFIKRLEKPDINTLIISGDNPNYPSRVLTRHDMNSIHIIGEVVWTARDV